MNTSNIGTCLVHYTINPPLTAEGDEDDATAIGYVSDAFNDKRVSYIGFTFPETPERLPLVDGVSNIYFTVPLAGVTPFNEESDFTGLWTELENHDGEITDGQYYEDSGKIKRMDILLNSII